MTIRDEKQALIDLMKNTADDPELLTDLKGQYKEACKRYSLVKVKRGNKETEEVQAELVVEYCVHFIEHLSKLWREAHTEDKFRLQSLVFPEGISYEALTGKQTPTLSPIYEAISDLKKGRKRMAAPRGIEPRFAG